MLLKHTSDRIFFSDMPGYNDIMYLVLYMTYALFSIHHFDHIVSLLLFLMLRLIDLEHETIHM